MDLTVSNGTCNQKGKINYLEHVVVILHARFDRRGYLEGFLTSPSGTTSQILPYRANDVIASDFNEWPILSMHFWGEDPQGDWRLRLQSRYPNYKFSGENGPANVGGCCRIIFLHLYFTNSIKKQDKNQKLMHLSFNSLTTGEIH